MSSQDSLQLGRTTFTYPKALSEAAVAQAEEPSLKPGDQLGSYELLAQLGKGGMGLVFRARHVRLKKDFAIKVLSPRLARDRDALHRFERETEALGRLEHIHLVRASDAGVENGTPFVVMEVLEGVELASLSEQLGCWPIAEACEAVRQAALGLQHAYERGLVHRDIKPSNLWLTPAGVVKVLDLGLARLVSEDAVASPMTAAGMWMGTPDYSAPEQILDSHSTDIRADLYSLGCTLFHMLTGEPPFGKSTHPTVLRKHEAHLKEPPPDVRQRRPDVPAELAAVLSRLLAKASEDRPQTPLEVATALTPFTSNARLEPLLHGDIPFSPYLPTTTGALPTTVTERRETAPCRSHPLSRLWSWVAATAVLLLVTIGLTVFLSLVGKTPSQPSSAPRQENTSAPEKITIRSLNITHFPTVRGHGDMAHVGVLGKTVFQTRLQDRVTLEARLSRPAYAFLIAFRPDGTPDVCFPESPDEPPPLTDQPRYPSQSLGDNYGLEEGVGLQAFALVVSSQPLPPFKEWWSQCPGCPWTKSDTLAGVVWSANGVDDVEAQTALTDNRGKGAEVAGKKLVAELAAWLRQAPGVETVKVLGFAVMPQEKR